MTPRTTEARAEAKRLARTFTRHHRDTASALHLIAILLDQGKPEVAAGMTVFALQLLRDECRHGGLRVVNGGAR